MVSEKPLQNSSVVIQTSPRVFNLLWAILVYEVGEINDNRKET